MQVIQQNLPESAEGFFSRPWWPPLLGRQFLALIAVVFVSGALISMKASLVRAQESDAPQPAATAETPSAEPPSSSPSDVLPPTSEKQPEDPRNVTAKVVRYAKRLVRTYDRNNNGQLEQAEWEAMHGAPSQVDVNGDGVIQVEELARHVAEYGRTRRIRLLPPQPGDLVELPPLLHPATADTVVASPTDAAASKPSLAAEPTAGEPSAAPALKKPLRRRDSQFYLAPERLPAGLPDWFLPRDLDGDGQLTISEFSPKNPPAELQQFKKLDRNGDGVLTADECVVRAAKEKEAKEPKAE